MCLKPHKSKPPTWARQGSSWRFVSIPSGSKMDPTRYLLEADQGWKLFSVQPRNSMWKTYPINTNRNLRYFQVTSSRLHSTNICCWFYIFVAERFPTGRHTECNMCCAYEYGVGLATQLFWGGGGFQGLSTQGTQNTISTASLNNIYHTSPLHTPTCPCTVHASTQKHRQHICISRCHTHSCHTLFRHSNYLHL